MIKKILVIGQTPPPYGGQAIMIDYMLKGEYENTKLFHIRVNFSTELSNKGGINIRKIAHLFTIISKAFIYRIINKIKILYYPLGCFPKSTVYKDAFILLLLRRIFPKVIYHFHAAGISEELQKYKNIERKLIYNILKQPNLTITPSIFNPPDGEYLQSKNHKLIPNGIPKINIDYDTKNIDNSNIKLLFIGLLNSQKGEVELIEALHLLLLNDIKNFSLNIAGNFEQIKYKEWFFNKLNQLNLSDKVNYWGIVKGEAKHKIFLESNILCYPSYFSSESFGLVILESMQYYMPIIGSQWRGIQSLIINNYNGFLVKIKDPLEIAEALKIFLLNPERISIFGLRSRNLFEDKYTIDNFILNMQKAFNEL